MRGTGAWKGGGGLGYLLVMTVLGESPYIWGSYMSWACAGGAVEVPARFTRA